VKGWSCTFSSKRLGNRQGLFWISPPPPPPPFLERGGVGFWIMGSALARVAMLSAPTTPATAMPTDHDERRSARSAIYRARRAAMASRLAFSDAHTPFRTRPRSARAGSSAIVLVRVMVNPGALGLPRPLKLKFPTGESVDTGGRGRPQDLRRQRMRQVGRRGAVVVRDSPLISVRRHAHERSKRRQRKRRFLRKAHDGLRSS